MTRFPQRPGWHPPTDEGSRLTAAARVFQVAFLRPQRFILINLDRSLLEDSRVGRILLPRLSIRLTQVI